MFSAPGTTNDAAVRAASKVCAAAHIPGGCHADMTPLHAMQLCAASSSHDSCTLQCTYVSLTQETMFTVQVSNAPLLLPHACRSRCLPSWTMSVAQVWCKAGQPHTAPLPRRYRRHSVKSPNSLSTLPHTHHEGCPQAVPPVIEIAVRLVAGAAAVQVHSHNSSSRQEAVEGAAALVAV